MRRFIRPAAPILMAALFLGTVAPARAEYRNLKKALKAAAKQDKDVMLVFSEPAACRTDCKDFIDKVLKSGEWERCASGKFVHVRIEYSRADAKKDGRRYYPGTVKDRFNIMRPVEVVVLDSAGHFLGRTGLVDRTGRRRRPYPKVSTSEIEEMMLRKKTIAAGLAAAERGDKKERLAAAVKLYQALRGWNIASVYRDLAEDIVRLDKGNTSGYKSALAFRLGLHYYKAGKKRKYKYFLKTLKKIDRAKAAHLEAKERIFKEVKPLMVKKKYQKALGILNEMLTDGISGEAAAIAHYESANMLFRMRKKDEAIGHLEKARAAAPKSAAGRKSAGLLKRLGRR